MTNKDASKVDIRFAMCFPDVYEIGMSHLGIQILYSMFNKRDDIYCERVYSPWMDLDPVLREKHIPLFTLETQEPVKKFDFLGITCSMRCVTPMCCKYWTCPGSLFTHVTELRKIPLLWEEAPVLIIRNRWRTSSISFI